MWRWCHGREHYEITSRGVTPLLPSHGVMNEGRLPFCYDLLSPPGDFSLPLLDDA